MASPLHIFALVDPDLGPIRDLRRIACSQELMGFTSV
jgi:hypothetical protein